MTEGYKTGNLFVFHEGGYVKIISELSSPRQKIILTRREARKLAYSLLAKACDCQEEAGFSDEKVNILEVVL